MVTDSQYTKNLKSGVYQKKGFSGIAYSDGSESEEYLLAYIRSCNDISDASSEIRSGIKDWISEYHLSQFRSNLLRPFDFSGKTVLELGCGCGAITRFLGEAGASVIAVEGNPMRALIAAERCRDLPNVSIYCDNLMNFEYHEKFDFVTLIGVLEYSNFYISDDNPPQACLKKAASLLKDTGDLYLAIENQLGLKYFNGCAEDHTSTCYFGTTDRYTKNTAITFGKNELTKLLRSANFLNQELFFPFPDYKLPEVILSEAGVSHPLFNVGDLLHSTKSRSYDAKTLPSFYEGLAWQVIARNNLVSDLANSFLIKASKHEKAEKPKWLALSYNSSRLKEFITETIFFEYDNKISVEKKSLFGLSTKEADFKHTTYLSDYANGKLYITILQKIIANNGDYEDIIAWAIPWINFLQSSSDDKGFLPSDYIDCIPTNLIYDTQNGFTYIDAEWESITPVPLIWVIMRGLIKSILNCPTINTKDKISFNNFFIGVLNKANISASDNQIKSAHALELKLRNAIFGKFQQLPPIDDWFAEMLLPWETYPTKDGFTKNELRHLAGTIDGLNRKIEIIESQKAELLADISRIKSTISWKTTKPLRAIFNISLSTIIYVKSFFK